MLNLACCNLCPGGGIGRRAGLKIQCWQQREGSIPSSGTINLITMDSKKSNKITFSFRPAPKILYTLLMAVAVVFVWRGLWILSDAFIFPENPILSGIVSTLIGLVILYLPDQDFKELF